MSHTPGPRRVFCLALAAAILAVGADQGVALATSVPARPHIQVTMTTHGQVSITLREKFTAYIPRGASSVAWSADNKTVAVSGASLSIFADDGRPLNHFPVSGSKGGTSSLAFINGSRQLISPVESAAPEGASLDIRDVATGRIAKTLTAGFVPAAYAVSPDQKRLALTDGATRLITYDTSTWQTLSTVHLPPKHGCPSLTYFPDSTRLAIGSYLGDLSIIDSTTGHNVSTLFPYGVAPGRLLIDSVAVDPEGLRLAEGGLRVVRVNDGTAIATFNDSSKRARGGELQWDPKGRFLAFTDATGLVVWQPQARPQSYTRVDFAGPVARVYNALIGQTVDFDQSTGTVMRLAISPNGNALAVTHGDSFTVLTVNDN